MKHWDPRLDTQVMPLAGLDQPQWVSGWEPYRRPRLPWHGIAQGFAAVLFLAVAWLSIQL